MTDQDHTDPLTDAQVADLLALLDRTTLRRDRGRTVVALKGRDDVRISEEGPGRAQLGFDDFRNARKALEDA